MENQKTLTMEQAINKDTIDYSTNDFYKPDFNLNVSNEISMEEAVKRQSLNADILDSLKPKDEINYGASVVEGFKQAGKRFSNTISDALDSVKLMTKNVDWFYPNMTEQERNDMALEIALTKKANKNYDAMMQHYNGTDNMITMGCGAIAQFLGQMGLNMIVPGLGSAQVGVQTVTDTAIDYVIDTMEKEDYNVEKAGNWKDNAITIANGAVQTFIEHKLGAERIVNGAFSKAMSGTLKAGATTAFSEGSEEFVQEWAGYLFNTMAGHEDRNVGQVLTEALTSAVVGGMIGGVAGAGNYKLKTLDVAKVLREKFGISDPKLANAMAQDMVDSVLNGAKEEMTIQAQFKYHYGENYDKFVGKVKNLLQESGWQERNPDKDLDKFAQLNADTLITPFINMANMSNMTAKDFFDVANMEVIGNQVVLDTRRFDNPNEIRRRIKEIDEQLKEENLIQGKDRTKQKQNLQSKKKTLQLILRKLNFEEMFDKEAITNNLARIQQSDVEKQAPQVVGSLNGIQEDWNFNNKGMYVGKHRIPVNMVVMDLKDINISHIEGEENPNYKNKALQNRVRNNINDSIRIQQKSNNLQPESLVFGNDTTTGSPVINLDGDVIAGNNRSELLRRAYVNQDQVPGLKERVEAYKSLLKQQGYNIDNMEMPILVRQVDLTPEQQVAVATVSNIPTMSAFQHSQRARNDAKAISNKGLTTPEAFLQNLTTDEKVEFELEKGNIDRLALDRRFNDAVMSLILDDNKLFESLILGNKLPKKIISAISNTAKTSDLLEKIKTDPKFKNDLKEALILASKTDINNLAMNMQQAEVGQDTPFNKNALLLLFTSGNMTQISDGLNGYITRINTQMDLLSNDSMFKNDIPVYSQEDLMKQTLKDIALTKGYFTEDGQVKKDLKDPKQQKMVENLLALFTSEAPSKSGTIEQQIIDEEDNRLFQEDNRDLLVQHGTSLEKLQDALDLGGMPMPSLAITKKDTAKQSYGNITFIGNKNIIDPEQDFRNKTFESDIYSTRRITPVYEINNNGIDYLISIAEKGKSNNGKTYWTVNIQEDLNRGTDYNLKSLYLVEKGKISDLESREVSDSINKMSEEDNIDFNKWKRNLINNFTEKKIFKGFTPAGNERFIKYDLYNVLAEMKQKSLKGSESGMEGTPHALRGVWSKEFNTITEIKERSSKIVDEDTYAKMDKTLNDASEKLSKILVPEEKAKELWQNFISPEEYMIIEALSKIKPSSNIKSILENAGLNSDKESVKAVKDFRKLVDEIPVVYFEAKPQRIVDFSEYTGVVIPEGKLYDEVAQRLSDEYGLRVVRKSKTDDYNNIINENFSDVFFQNSRYNGFFDADLKTILLGENMNEGTLQHEIAHFFLDRCFEIWQNGTGTEQFNSRFQQIADMLGINENQAKLTTGQQEQWARMTEAYLFGKGMPADRLPLMDQFMQWIPAQYQTIEDLQYKGDDGQLHNPLISKESAEIFDRLYTLGYTGEGTTGNSFNNPTNKEDKYLPVDAETQKAREKILNDGATKSEVPTFNMKEFAQNLEEYQPEVKEEPKPETMTGKAKQFVNKVLAGRGTNTREQMTKDAQDYISKNRQHAEEIAFGNPIDGEPDFVYNDSGIDRVILTREVAKLYSNNLDTYNLLMGKAAIARSIASKSAGLTNDWNTKLFMDGYQQMIKSAKDKVFLKRYGNKGDINQLEVDMNNIINKWASRIAQAQGISQASIIAEANADIRKEFDIDTDIFFQEDFIREKKSSSLAKYGVSKLKQALGIEPSAEDISKLQTLSDLALSTVNDIDSPDIEKSIQAVKNFKAYKEFIESKKIPQTALDKITTDWSSNAMLSNPSTMLMSNVAPNTVEYLLSKASLRAYYGKNVVDEDLKKQAIDKIGKIYQATGEDLSQMAQLKDKTLLLGEVYNPEKPDTWFRKPTKWIGAENAWFRRHVFINTLSHIASKNAKGDVAKANELFKSYLNIANQTEEGQKARLEAVLNGELVTFTNNGKLAQAMVKVRQLLNSVSVNYKGGRVVFGDGTGIKLGQLLMPFPKTPSNIVQTGFNAAIAPATALYHGFITHTYSFADTSNLVHFAAGLLGYAICSWLDIKYNPQKNKYDPAGDTIEIGGVKMKISSLGPASSAFRSIYSLLNAKGDIDSMINTGLSSLPVFDTMDNLTMAKEHTVQWFNNFMANNVNKMLIPGLLRYPANYLGGLTGYKTNDKWVKPWVRGLGMTRSKSNIEKPEDIIIKSLFGRYVQF